MTENYVSAENGSIVIEQNFVLVKKGKTILYKCPKNLWSSLVHACKTGNRMIRQKDLCEMFGIKVDDYYITSGVVKRIIRQAII